MVRRARGARRGRDRVGARTRHRHRARDRAARAAAHDRAEAPRDVHRAARRGRSWCRSRSACVVTVAAAVLPALRAARVPPVAAINDTRPRLAAGSVGGSIAGLAVTALSGAVLVYGLVRAENVTGVVDQVQVVALGAFGVLVGVVMLLATVARPLAAGVGWPLRVLGMSGSLARANAMRNPRRTAVTASALVIGLALVGLTATFGESAKASVAHDTGTGLRADYVVKSDGFAGFSGDVAEPPARAARARCGGARPVRRRRHRRRRRNGGRGGSRRLEQGRGSRLRERWDGRPRPGRGPPRRRHRPNPPRDDGRHRPAAALAGHLAPEGPWGLPK